MPQGAVYIASLVMASAAAPDNFVKGGKARVFGTEDLASIVGNASVAATAALAIMHEVMAIESKVGAPLKESVEWTTLRGHFFVNLVMHVHAKKSPHRAEYSSPNELAVNFFDDLQRQFASVPAVRALCCPWSFVPLATRPRKQARTEAASTWEGGIRELTCSGDVTPGVLAELGFKDQAVVRLRGSKGTEGFRIVEAREDGTFLLSNGKSIRGATCMEYEVVQQLEKDSVHARKQTMPCLRSRASILNKCPAKRMLLI